MHSNKICAFLLLCFALLISDVWSQLRTDYYDSTCRGLEKIVWDGVVNATKYNSRVPAFLLRLHFHDCFVLGCEASVLLVGQQGELNAGPNRNSIFGLDVIENIKKQVEKQCPGIVSCADILALAARDAVKISFNKSWDVPFGRLDGVSSSQNGANRDLPSPFDPLATIIAKFANKGLNIQDMVALSGGHTIGKTKCSSFRNRLYFVNSTANVNGNFLNDLRIICKNNTSTDNSTVDLDKRSPIIFDNQYYVDIRNKEAVLESDQTLYSDNRTIRWVHKYSAHPDDFFKDFREAMLRMGNIGVITNGGNGQIRKICSKTN